MFWCTRTCRLVSRNSKTPDNRTRLSLRLSLISSYHLLVELLNFNLERQTREYGLSQGEWFCCLIFSYFFALSLPFTRSGGFPWGDTDMTSLVARHIAYAYQNIFSLFSHWLMTLDIRVNTIQSCFLVSVTSIIADGLPLFAKFYS